MNFFFAAMFIAVLSYAGFSNSHKVIMHESTSSVYLLLHINPC